MRAAIHMGLLSGVMVLMMTGCSGNHYSIHHVDELDSEHSTAISVDAKQRLVLTNQRVKEQEEISTVEGKPDEKKTKKTKEILMRFCAEASPDVFSVLSQSGSGSLSAGQAADPKTVNIALQAAFTSAETGSTISRTQTVNMLKEMMYRTCERFLNGQIGELEYPIIAARDQRIMTSILAIEQLTGVITPRPIAISASSEASTGDSASAAITAIDAAHASIAQKNGVFDSLQKEFTELDSSNPSCAVIMAKTGGAIDEAEKSKLDQCKAKKKSVDDAKKELDDAKKHYETIAGLAGKPGASLSKASGAVTASPSATAIDKEIELARLAAVQNVSGAVQDIVEKSFNRDDETAFFCYRIIEMSGQKQIAPSVGEHCMEFITQKLETETAKLKQEEVEAQKSLIDSKVNSFDVFWTKIKNENETVNTQKLEALILAKFPKKISESSQEKLEAMKSKKSKEDIKNIFVTLPMPIVKRLVND